MCFFSGCQFKTAYAELLLRHWEHYITRNDLIDQENHRYSGAKDANRDWGRWRWKAHVSMYTLTGIVRARKKKRRTNAGEEGTIGEAQSSFVLGEDLKTEASEHLRVDGVRARLRMRSGGSCHGMDGSFCLFHLCWVCSSPC